MARPKKEEVNPKVTNPNTGTMPEKMQAVNIAMDQITKQFGTGSIMRLGDSQQNQMKVDVIPTGSIALDIALGVGGLPRGRIIEIYGPEASGKTSVCLHVIAEAQKNGGTAAFIDAEHALDPVRAQGIGVKLDELLIAQPDTGEQALEIAETLIRSGGVDVLVVDSVAALVPKAEIEGDMGDSVMGLQARLMSQAMRKLTGAVSKSKTVLIFTNQLRMKIGIMFGNPETTTGGQALKFYSSVRIDMRKIGNITESEKIVGSQHRAKVVKNKVAPPFRIAEFDIMNDRGISKAGGLVDVATEFNIIQKTGSFYKYNGEVLAQGRDGTKLKLEEDPKLAHAIEAAIWQRVKSGNTVPNELGEKSEDNNPDSLK
jgi:recombination protein RecA